MHRVHIIGGSGAGKSVLGAALAARLGVPLIELDDLFWDPGWREVGHAELARRLAPQLDPPGWVVAGNYFATTEPRVWPRATHLVVLDLPYPLMLWRTLRRTLHRGLSGQPCCNGNVESIWRLFHRDGVLRYLTRTWRKRHARYATLPYEPALAHTRVLHLRSTAAVRALLADPANALKARAESPATAR